MTDIPYSHPYRTGCPKVPYASEAEANAAVRALLTRKYPSKRGWHRTAAGIARAIRGTSVTRSGIGEGYERTGKCPEADCWGQG